MAICECTDVNPQGHDRANDVTECRFERSGKGRGLEAGAGYDREILRIYPAQACWGKGVQAPLSAAARA